jgi:hypothetical protein
MIWSLMLNVREKSNLISMMLLGALIGISSQLQIEYLATAFRTPQELLSLGGIALLGLISLLSIPAFVFNGNNTAKNIIQLSLTIFLIATLIANYLLTFDGRYRDFAIILYALPILQLSLGLQILKQSIQLSFSAYRWLGILLIATSGICLYREPSNLFALAWLCLCVLIAWANWPVKTASTIQNTPSI